MKHKTQDYKITAVKYYLQNDDSLDYVSIIFACKKTSNGFLMLIDRHGLIGVILVHWRNLLLKKQQICLLTQVFSQNMIM